MNMCKQAIVYRGSNYNKTSIENLQILIVFKFYIFLTWLSKYTFQIPKLLKPYRNNQSYATLYKGKKQSKSILISKV